MKNVRLKIVDEAWSEKYDFYENTTSYRVCCERRGDKKIVMRKATKSLGTNAGIKFFYADGKLIEHFRHRRDLVINPYIKNGRDVWVAFGLFRCGSVK